MREGRRKITKEQYDRYKETGIKYDEVFDMSLLCGYGVYGARLCEENGEYLVKFDMGDSCD